MFFRILSSSFYTQFAFRKKTQIFAVFEVELRPILARYVTAVALSHFVLRNVPHTLKGLTGRDCRSVHYLDSLTPKPHC